MVTTSSVGVGSRYLSCFELKCVFALQKPDEMNYLISKILRALISCWCQASAGGNGFHANFLRHKSAGTTHEEGEVQQRLCLCWLGDAYKFWFSFWLRWPIIANTDVRQNFMAPVGKEARTQKSNLSFVLRMTTFCLPHTFYCRFISVPK